MKENRMSEPIPLLWIDIETTGLDIKKDFLLEVACFITDPTGNPIQGTTRNWVIKPYERLWATTMIDFVSKMHRESGLIKEVNEMGIREDEFLEEFEEFIVSTGVEKFTMAGSGVGPFDRIWFKTNYPHLEDYFTYYVMDVGVLGRFFRNVMQIDLPERPVVNHRALDDIQEHYEEFLQYKGLLTK